MKKHIKEQVVKRTKSEARKKLQPTKAELNEKGEEICDPQPVFADIGFKEPPSINDKIRAAALEVYSQQAAKLQAESMTREQALEILNEESDYDIPDETVDILTTYEQAGLVTELQETGVYLEPETSTTAEEPVPTTTDQSPSSTAEQDVTAETAVTE